MASRELRGVFEVDFQVRKMRNGHRLRLILESPYDRVEAKALEDFRFGTAKVHLQLSEAQGVLDMDEQKKPARKK